MAHVCMNRQMGLARLDQIVRRKKIYVGESSSGVFALKLMLWFEITRCFAIACVGAYPGVAQARGPGFCTWDLETA